MIGRRLRLAALALQAGFMTVACFGTVDDAQESATPSGPTAPGSDPSQPGQMPSTGGPAPAIPPSGPSSGPSACSETAPLVTAARRLTREQYSHTISDLFGSKSAFGDKLPADDNGDGLFVAPGTLIVTPTFASNAMGAAEEIAKAAVANIGTLVPCSIADGESCAKTFIERFGKRAYRRPLAGDEVTDLLAVYKVGATNGGASHGIELVIQAMLQSPSFLYRLELGQKAGTGAGAVKLSPYEIASRLSYGLVGTMPDEELMKAADDNQLDSPDRIAAHARRLVVDPRARATIVEFANRWLGIEHLTEVMKDPAVYPQFDDALVESLKSGTAAFVDEVLKGDGRWDTLLTAPFAMVDAKTAPLYGVAAPSGTGPVKTNLPGGKRMGFLTSVGVLTAHTFADPSAAIHRGKFVRERLLCTDPPNPSADLMIEPPTPEPGVTTRERLKQHTDNPACSGCHEFMDPIGFAFENFDGLGRWRDTEQGKPIDNQGQLNFTDVDGPFKGVSGLVEKLAVSTKVRDCVTGTFLRFVSGTESQLDTCAESKLKEAFIASRGDLRELIVAITRTDAFTYRRAIAGEVLP